jgi:hypothetical protein
MLMKTKPWWIACWTLQLTFHPLCWRLRGAMPAKAGREVCALNDSSYWFVSVGPFTLAERYLQ